ncbi:MAG: Tim44-like domain-containing protein [Proteobacteria bacterium]|jgi:hypothetical protein|nr:Tim44-like domain-containing protein [Pseudomonadota bacterium]
MRKNEKNVPASPGDDGALRVALVCLVVLTVLCAAFAVLARAGGGENYVGGGGGGGGGGGDGDIFVLLIWLAVEYPYVGVPLLVAFGAFVVVKKVRGPNHQTRKAVAALERAGAPSTAMLGKIKERDPGFDEAAFLARAKKIELALQEAWCRGDMAKVRPFTSDGLHRRFAAQLAIMKSQGVRNAMANHEVTAATIHAVETGAHFDAIHVLFAAKGRDVQVDAALTCEQATAKAAKAAMTSWSEVWSFLRRPGAQSASGDEAARSACPSCGAPLPDGGEAVKCDHCNVLVNSGDHDWVLAEITQPEEWRATSTGEVQGLAALAARDPGFNRQAAEDRGSYVFWRWVEALAIGADRPLAKCATAEMRRAVAEQVKAGAAKLYKTAVGGVDLVGCEVGPDGGRDRFHVRVLWSSARSQGERPVHASNVMTLARNAGGRDPGGLSYAHCPACKGPLEENDSPKCDYCGEALDAGRADWVLEAVRRPEEIAYAPQASTAALPGAAVTAELAAQWVPDMANGRERMLLLMRMAAIVVADNQVTKDERKLLATCAKRWSVPLEAVEPILTGQVPAEVVMTLKPARPDAFLMGLVSAALVDGKVDKKEEQLLLDVSKNLGLEEAFTKNMITTMTHAAKAAAAR